VTSEEIRNDDLANLDRDDDDDGRHHIGQHMANQDLDRGGAHGPGGRKIVMLRQTNKISTYRGKCGIGSSRNSLLFAKMSHLNAGITLQNVNRAAFRFFEGFPPVDQTITWKIEWPP
jgi:hypothetical protein